MQLYLKQKNYPAARTDLERAIALEPAGSHQTHLASAYVELARLHQGDKDNAAALKSAEAALRVQPGLGPAYRAQGEALLALNRYEEAGKALDAYLTGSANPGRTSIWMRA